jgi:hypothetical protein
MTWPELPPPYDAALHEAVEHVLARFEVWGVIVAGSVLAGMGDPRSDLDLYVIHARPQRQRIQRRFAGVAVEIFVNPPHQVRRYFDEEATRPCTAHMLATGVVVVHRHEVVGELIAEARRRLATPPNLSATQLTFRRYLAADLLENAQDVIDRDPANADLFLHEGVRAMLDYAWLAANRPLPRFKQYLTTLEAFDADLGALARRYYTAPDAAARLALATQIAARTIGETGFFEWESPIEEVPA